MTALHDHVLKVADLVGRPGASRRLDLVLGVPPDLGLEAATIAEPVRLTGVLESVVDGILVRGTLAAHVVVACARCLTEVQTTLETDVAELYSDPDHLPPDVDTADLEDGYLLQQEAVDLDPLLRDSLVPAVPVQAHCRPDCAGLCPNCGVDRNEAACDCTDEQQDLRWSALRDLHMPEAN